MASNKKTTDPCFSNGTEAMWFQDRNCQHCIKYTQYNEKLGRYPQFKCAVQRDMELQQVGIEEISLRSWEACQQTVCPYIKRKDNDTEGKHTTPKTEKPMPLFKEQEPINIQAEAERIRAERIAKAEEAERAKELDQALAKAFDRRMQRSYFPVTTKKVREVTPEMEKAIRERGVEIKEKLNDILLSHYGRYVLCIRAILNAADNLISEIVSELRARKKYKHQVKFYVNDAINRYEAIVSDLDFETKDFDDFNMVVLSEARKDITMAETKLYYALKNAMDKLKLKDTAFGAKLELVYFYFSTAFIECGIILKQTQIETATLLKKEGISTLKGTNENIASYYPTTELKSLCDSWERMTNMLVSYSKSEAKAIGDDFNVSNGVIALERKLTDFNNYQKICDRVELENKGILDDYYDRHPELNRKMIV